MPLCSCVQPKGKPQGMWAVTPLPFTFPSAGDKGPTQGQGPPSIPSWLPVPSPLNTNLWLAELTGDEDQAFLSDAKAMASS